jgi:transcriptional regulator with XRE-family HTH domain
MDHDLRARLKKARQELRLTQAEASVEWGVSLGTLVSWENNQRRPHAFTLSALNRLLDSILGAPPGEPADEPFPSRTAESFAETVLRHAGEGRRVNPLAVWHAESLRAAGNQPRDRAG